LSRASPRKETTLAGARGAAERIERERLIELKRARRDDGEEVTIRLLAKNGALGIGVLQDNGETRFVPLKRIRTQRQKDKAAYRFYNQYEMPKEYATREITVRLHNSVEEEARRLNRAENLRAILRRTLTSTDSTRGEAMPSPSTGTSRTAFISRRPTASDTSARRLISLDSPNS